MVKDQEIGNVISEDVNMETGSTSQYALDFLILRNAIVDNCKDCIRDCGRDCLDRNVKPLENIRCPLQKVRIEYEIVIEEKAREDPVIFSSKYHGFELK